MNKSESIIELSKALVKFHSVMGKVSKDAKNPFFKNKYASLSNIIEAVTKPLNDNGLSVLQLPSIEGLTTLLLHESGEWISSVSSTPVKDATDPQKLGSAITYARRYALGAILSLNIDEDDDGQKAATPTRQDNTHIAKSAPKYKPQPKAKPELKPKSDEWSKAVQYLVDGGLISAIEGKYAITEVNKTALMDDVLK